MGYDMRNLTKEERSIFDGLTRKCWDGEKRDLEKLNIYERRVLLSLMEKAGVYTPKAK